MKKIAALVILVVMLFTSAALADDLSSLSDAELINLGREVLDELERRQAGSREEAFSPVQADTDEAHPALPQLVLFFDYWSRNQYDEMLGFCLPEWKEQCENPLFELFKILQNRTPKSLSPEKISPSDPEGTVCTVTATAEIDRNNGTAPALYRLQIRMAKGADGLWYVDPESLLTYETAEETPLPEPTPVPAPGAQDLVTIAASEFSAGNSFQPVATEEDNLVVSRLSEFFVEWNKNDLDGMLACCMPEWQLKQESARTTLFALLRNRTPLNVIIEGITPAEPADTFRRVLASADMDRHNGEDPVRFLLVIWMVRSGDGLWYFDPGCLSNPDRLDLVTQAEPTPDPAVTEQFDDSAETVLYYNPTGGEYYHCDPNCRSVNPKFQPLAGTFRFSEVNDEPYVHLNPCNVCGAPLRRAEP